MTDAFADAAIIEASLARAADLGGDLTLLVYARLFAARPDLEPLFGADASNAVKGEMLAQVFDTILDFIGPRVFADHMLRAHGTAHDGYGVPPDVFLGFFSVVAATIAEVLGDEWPGPTADAWEALLGDLALTLRESPVLT
jgi:hemoglobin-like flavoprotein